MATRNEVAGTPRSKWQSRCHLSPVQQHTYLWRTLGPDRDGSATGVHLFDEQLCFETKPRIEKAGERSLAIRLPPHYMVVVLHNILRSRDPLIKIDVVPKLAVTTKTPQSTLLVGYYLGLLCILLSIITSYYGS